MGPAQRCDGPFALGRTPRWLTKAKQMSEALSMEAFAAELSASEPEAQADPAATPEAAEQPESELPTAEGDPNEAEPQGEAEDADPEAADEPPEQAAPALSDDAELEWETSSGEKFKAPLRELKDGYMRRDDYAHKTQQLAEDKRQSTAQAQQRFAEAEAHAEDLAALRIVQTRLQEFAKVPWDQLQQSDPQRFTMLKIQQQELERTGQNVLQNAQQRRAQVAQERTAADEQRRSAEAQAAVEALRKDTPGFGEKHVEAINAWALKNGVTADTLKNLTHPTLLLAMHKAAQWDALQAKKPALDNRVKAVAPKAVGRTQAPVTTGKEAKVVATLRSKSALSPREFTYLLNNA